MLYPQGKLIIFSKAPEPGFVMTRLAQSLNECDTDGWNIAAKIHEFLVLERLKQAAKENIAPVELWCAPDTSHSFFNQCKKKFSISLKEQPSGNIGERMAYAFDDALSTHSFAVLIGTDCPGMTANVIKHAFNSLDRERDSVIGPAEDGGYVLIGLTQKQPKIFQDIEWGSSQVFDTTIERLRGAVKRLPTLWDIDRIDDLQRLIRESDKLKLSQDFIRYLDEINLTSISHTG